MEKAKHMKGKRFPGWQLLLSYLLSLFLVGISLALVILRTIGNADYFIRAIENSSYATAMYESLCDNYRSYGAAAGFSEEVMTSFISPDQIEIDLVAAVDKMYGGDVSMTEHPEIHDSAMSAMKESADARGYEVTPDVEEALKLVADACQADYENYVCVPLVSQFGGFVDKAQSGGMGLLAVTGLLALVAVGSLVCRTGIKDFKLRMAAFSVLSAAMVCAILGFGAYPLLHLEQINVSPEALKLLICNYVQGLFAYFGIFAVGFFVLSLIMIAVECAARKKRNHQEN